MAVLGLSCSIWDLCCHGVLRHVRYSFLIRDWTHTPPHWELGVSTTGPLGKSCLFILYTILGWPKSSFGFPCKTVQKSLKELFGHPNGRHLWIFYSCIAASLFPLPLVTTYLFSISVNLFLLHYVHLFSGIIQHLKRYILDGSI